MHLSVAYTNIKNGDLISDSISRLIRPAELFYFKMFMLFV